MIMGRTLKKLTYKIYKYLNANGKLNEDEELYLHAIELTLHEGFTFFLVLLISCFINIFFETVVYLVTFTYLRKYTGSYHAVTYSRCMTLYVAFYLVFVMILRTKNVLIILVVYLLSVIVSIYIYINSPVQHINNKLTIMGKHRYRKLSLIILVIYVLSCLILLAIHSKISYIIAIVVVYDALLMIMLKYSSGYFEG